MSFFKKINGSVELNGDLSIDGSIIPAVPATGSILITDKDALAGYTLTIGSLSIDIAGNGLIQADNDSTAIDIAGYISANSSEVTASPSNPIIITALVPGLDGNSIIMTYNNGSTGLTLSGATLTGGVAETHTPILTKTGLQLSKLDPIDINNNLTLRGFGIPELSATATITVVDPDAMNTHSATGSITIVDYTQLAGTSVSFQHPSEALETYTEGVQWTASVDNNTTAASLADAIGGVSIYVSTNAVGNVIQLTYGLANADGNNVNMMTDAPGSGLTLSGATLTGGTDYAHFLIDGNEVLAGDTPTSNTFVSVPGDVNTTASNIQACIAGGDVNTVTATVLNDTISMTYNTPGAIGNSVVIDVSGSNGGVTASGTHFTGGQDMALTDMLTITPNGLEMPASSPILASDGSLSAPSIAFSSFPTTGFFTSAFGPLRAVANGTEIWKADSRFNIFAEVRMNSHRLDQLPDPTGSTDAATKGYVDARPANLYNVFSDSGNSGTTETTIFSDSSWGNDPHPFFNPDANGVTYLANVAGTLSTGTSSKRFQVKFDGAVLFDSTALALGTGTWELQYKMIRSDGSNPPNTARYSVVLIITSSAVGPAAIMYQKTSEFTLSGTDWSQNHTFEVTATASGTGATDNDILATFGHSYKLQPAQ